MKLLFVASDFSGLGKGAFSAALAKVLSAHGVRVRIMKSDLYFNYDAGTINPQEHGEVYVLADGTEVDQDFGMYERFTGTESSETDYITSGRIFHQIYLNEREGKYLGQTVSTEHVIDEIKSRFLKFAEQTEVGIVELGATIGDIKGIYALEACRELISEMGSANAAFILLSHFPYLANVQELKTMGCQRSVSALRAKGIQPNIIVARTPADHPLVPEYQLEKLARYCGVRNDYVFCLPDLPDEYNIPQALVEGSLHQVVALQLGLILRQCAPGAWQHQFDNAKDVRIALVGKYSHADAYISILKQLRLLGVTEVECIPDEIGLERFDGVIIPGGWGKRGTEGLIRAAERCRREKIPTLGICLGLQIMVIEYARNVVKLAGATSAEFDADGMNKVIVLQEDQKKRAGLGGSSRLGNWTTLLEPESMIAEIYGSQSVVQRHRHRFEVSPDVDYGDFRISGRDQKTELIEVMELLGHPFYVGVQYHPEFGPGKNPLIGAFVESVARRKDLKTTQTYSRPNSSVHPDNIVPADIQVIREIAQLSKMGLQERGLSIEQQNLFKSLVELFDSHTKKMVAIEEDIHLFERRMRDINLNPRRQLSGQLSESDIQLLKQLEARINERQSDLRECRFRLEADFNRIGVRLNRASKAQQAA